MASSGCDENCQGPPIYIPLPPAKVTYGQREAAVRGAPEISVAKSHYPMKTKDLFIGAFALVLAGVLAFLWLSPSGLKEAPAIALTTLNGRQVQLSELRGHPVLVTFWATSCPGCVKEMPHLAELYRELNPKGFQIVALAMQYDPPEQVREMAARRELPYLVALDSSGEAARAFGDVRLTPTHFLIDPEGRIVQQKLGELDMAQLRTRIIGMLGNV